MQEKIRLSQVLTLFHSRIPQKWLSFWNDVCRSFREYMIYFSRGSCTCEHRKFRQWQNPSALCKLSFAFVNDKLQEAEESNEKLKKQVLWLSFLCMTNDCPFEMIMPLFLGAEPFLLDDSQIETARRRSRRAGMSRAKYTRVKEESARNESL